MKQYGFILISLCFALSLQGQERLRFEYYTQAEGLSNNQVQCLFQDSKGFLWVGTSNGICLNHWWIKSPRQEKMHLANNDYLVRDILEDFRGEIWVAYEEGGLCRYDQEKEEIVRYPLAGSSEELYSANRICEGPDSSLWIATENGLYTVNRVQHRLEKIAVNLPPHLRRLAFDPVGRLWIGSEQGLFLYDPLQKSLLRISLGAPEYSIDEIWALHLDRDGRMYVGTYHGGLFAISPSSLDVEKISLPNDKRAQSVKAIARDRQGILWIGTRGGLFTYKNGEIREPEHDKSTTFSSNFNSILSLLVDAKGDLWVGSRGGLALLNAEKQVFLHYGATGNDRGLNNSEVFAFHCPNDQEIWVGTEAGGINFFNRKSGRFTALHKGNSALKSDGIKTFCKIGTNVWVGTYQGGIAVVDEKSKSIQKVYLHQEKNPHSLIDNRVWAITKDRNQRIWIGSSRGVDEYDPQSQRFLHHGNFGEKEQIIFWIKEDAQGKIWFGGSEQLIIYDPQSRSKRVYKGRTRDFFQVNAEQFWVATHHGLAFFTRSKGFERVLTTADGLSNNMVYSLLPDNEGQVWMSTANGISIFNLRQENFVNYFQEDGLQNNQFNYGAFGLSPRGEFLFGGIEGFNLIHPDHIPKNQYIPPILLTELRIMNKVIALNDPEQDILQKALSYTSTIRLAHRQNSIALSFLALNYAKPEKNQYAYYLEGFDKDWIYSKNNNTASYTNLRPGKYIFRVKASNNDGVWNEEGLRLYIRIAPPFWGTWWFISLLVLLVIGIVYALARFYVHKENLKNKIVFEKNKAKKLHEIDLLKQQFFFNVSHEIRTPLTLVMGPVEHILQSEDINDNTRSQLKIVERNARQLLKLINQLLDFRKLQTGKYQVNFSKGDAVSFVNQHIQDFRYLAEEKGLQLRFEANPQEIWLWMDTDKWEKILNNLISNALKFTDKGGKVDIQLRLLPEYTFENDRRSAAVEVIVSDTGIGIAEKHLPKIFNRFFQTLQNQSVGGSGIGLNITQNFVQLMGGDIDVQSKTNEGTRFCLHFPIFEDQEVDDLHKPQPSTTEHKELATADSETVGNHRWMMVVDDNADIRQFVKGYFEGEFNILEADNGKDALELAIKHLPDIIISDVIMPAMDGTEMCRRLKKDERTSHIPILLLTAATSKESEMKGLMAGADDYIAKPFDLKLLNIKVDNLLAIRITMREKFRMEHILQPENKEIASPDDKFLQKAVQAMEKYMDDPDLDIELFSREVGVSRMQLYRKMQALTNMTVKEFIRDIRLKRAAQLLKQKNLSVSEVTFQVGFRDIQYFRKCFREMYGVNPSEY